MVLRRLLYVFLCVWYGLPASALSLVTAQQCATELLAGYSQREVRNYLVDIPILTATAVGPEFRLLRDSQRSEIVAIATRVLVESFRNPSGKYRFRDLVVHSVESASSRGNRVRGTVHITSERLTDTASFVAIVAPGNTCKVREVRIAEVYTLSSELRSFLEADHRFREILRQAQR